MKKIVIYGGAFSPPHIGHASSVEIVTRLFPCDEIWIMPSADRHDKKITASASHRLKMLKILIKEFFPNPKIPVKLSTLEIDRPKLTTTYETKLELEKKYPGAEFWFLIGSDLLLDIENKWVNGKDLYQSANFLAIKKSDAPLPDILPPKFRLLEKEVFWIDISSTFIRNLLGKGYSGLPYISPGVAEYVRKNGLYQ
ncbi:MAG: nicotinate-nucleotide adenylyltransferase [Patescibacteria group bacterium]